VSGCSSRVTWGSVCTSVETPASRVAMPTRRADDPTSAPSSRTPLAGVAGIRAAPRPRTSLRRTLRRTGTRHSNRLKAGNLVCTEGQDAGQLAPLWGRLAWKAPRRRTEAVRHHPSGCMRTFPPCRWYSCSTQGFRGPVRGSALPGNVVAPPTWSEASPTPALPPPRTPAVRVDGVTRRV